MGITMARNISAASASTRVKPDAGCVLGETSPRTANRSVSLVVGRVNFIIHPVTGRRHPERNTIAIGQVQYLRTGVIERTIRQKPHLRKTSCVGASLSHCRHPKPCRPGSIGMNYSDVQIVVELKVHSFWVRVGPARLLLQAVASFLRIDPKLHWNPFGNCSTLATARNGQKPPCFGIECTSTKEISDSGQGQGEDHDDYGHHQKQFDESKSGRDANPAWRRKALGHFKLSKPDSH